ncbi:MAG: putative phage abortive infection protein, partial [Arcobacteraceae bacterium]|nr:putative phage abortive infection protein [Arcobacteraceae bacterium]
RYLYNIVRFVSESGYKDGPYMRLIRAQLSDQELLLLFYNSISEHGNNFRTYIEDFALLDNMPQIRLLNKEHAVLLKKSAYGE